MTHLLKHYPMAAIINNERGVTLMEAMVYTAMAGMLLATAVTAFLGQNKSYNKQDVIAEIQQNIRGATEQMASDIRFAGVGLKEDDDYESFLTAEHDTFSIHLGTDLNEDWGALNGQIKIVRYQLEPGTFNLQRGVEGVGVPITWNTIAENIERLEFEYLIDGDLGDWEWENSVAVDDMDQIRAVKIIMLGRARASAFNPTDGTVYNPPLQAASAIPDPPPWTPDAGTGYRRLMSQIIQTRNNRG